MRPELEEYQKIDPETQAFLDEYRKQSPSPEMQKTYNMIMRERFRESSMMAAHYELGFEKGIEIGKRMNAKNLLDLGMSPEEVAKYTTLPLETILSLTP
jgi:hypothetical protein